MLRKQVFSETCKVKASEELNLLQGTHAKYGAVAAPRCVACHCWHYPNSLSASTALGWAGTALYGLERIC